MSRDVILGLAAATLMGITLAPVDALAHHRWPHPWLKVCGAGDYRGWNPASRNPGQQGYPGPAYSCDCFRESRRTICPSY